MNPIREAGIMGYSGSEFEKVLERIETGEAVDGSELLPFLTLEPREERYRINLHLAGAYLRRHERLSDARDLDFARSCIDRALVLSRYSPEVLPLLIEINQALRDVDAIKEALKWVGIEEAARGHLDEALVLFDRWMYAHAEFTGIDTHSYDPEIIACIERMSAPDRFVARARPRRAEEGERIRLAYLTHGLTHVNSVLVKIDQVFARLHDKSRFAVAYFTTEGETTVAASPDAQAAIGNIIGSGCEVFVPPDGEMLHERLLSVGSQIRAFDPDILITSAALASFKNYFVTCLKPAPVTIGFHQGPSPQFAWHTLNHSISWFLTTLPDCPADCSHVPLELDLPRREEIRPASRADLELPEAATVMASSGRAAKFQSPGYWRAMADILRENANLYWLIIGLSEDQVPFLESILTSEVRARVRFRGWRRDYLELLALADLAVDSYPVGGGVVLTEAMSLGLPVVSFKHDYINLFSNNDCSGGDEIVALPELMIARGDFGQLKACITELARDDEYRRRLGERCYERALKRQGDPSRMVRRCEEIYERVLHEQHEAELKRRAAQANGHFFPRLKRGLRRRWHEMRGR